jgi:hypothetical protein
MLDEQGGGDLQAALPGLVPSGRLSGCLAVLVFALIADVLGVSVLATW